MVSFLSQSRDPLVEGTTHQRFAICPSGQFRDVGFWGPRVDTGSSDPIVSHVVLPCVRDPLDP